MLIVINGMPRSGSTLLFNILYGYLKRKYNAKSVGHMNEEDLSLNINQLKDWAKSKDILVLKTHFLLPYELQSLIEEGSVRQIYSHRDLLAVGKSMLRVWSWDIEQVYEALERHTVISQEIIRNPYNYVVPYTFLSKNQEEALVKLVTWLGGDPDRDLILSVISDFNNIQENKTKDPNNKIKSKISLFTRSLSEKLRIGRFLKKFLPYRTVQIMRNKAFLIDNETMLHPGHVSSGDLPEQNFNELSDFIEAKFSDWRARFGYSSGSDELMIAGRSAPVTLDSLQR